MNSKDSKIAAFDPNTFVNPDSIFGLPFTYEESETILLPVPWEATASYGAGSSLAPDAIIQASWQMDLYDPFYERSWRQGIYMLPVDQKILNLSKTTKKIYADIINSKEGEKSELRDLVNSNCQQMVDWVESAASKIINDGKRVVVLGGSHSTPYGLIRSLANQYDNFGILQFDAHADLRNSYQGFTYSHASIMFNALKHRSISKLIQVCIRDYCEEELDIIKANPGRIQTFFDREIKQRQYRGDTWKAICADIIMDLPEKVYLSFDIDGLRPSYCPSTGTPVHGGLEPQEVLYLMEQLVESGREIIAFDLVEVVPSEDEWDCNVASRILYSLINAMAKSLN